MKRTPMPRRLVQLRSGTELRRTSELTRRGRLRARAVARRTPPAPAVSNVQTAAARQVVRDVVLARDRGCLLVAHRGSPVCYGPPEAHHLVKAHKKPPYLPLVLVQLCRGHNGWVEDWPAAAHALGLVVREGETPQDAWRRLQAAGLVDYWWDGTPADGPAPRGWEQTGDA